MQYKFSMLGHLNSVKDIAISEVLANTDQIRYIASASQDNNIRVWKIQPLKCDSEDDDWMKKYETKTSYVIRLSKEQNYNITLESVIQHH